MINFKNSLKKFFAGAFGVITMLSPLFQNNQCLCKSKFTYRDVAAIVGLKVEELSEEDIKDLENEAELLNQEADRDVDKILNNLEIYYNNAVKDFNNSTMTTVPFLLKVAENDMSKYCHWLNHFRACHKSEKICDYPYLCYVTRTSLIYIMNNLTHNLGSESPFLKSDLVCLKMFIDFIYHNMSPREQYAIFFGNKQVEIGSPVMREFPSEFGKVKIKFDTVILDVLNYYDTRGEKDDIRGVCAYHDDGLGRRDTGYREMITQCKKIIAKMCQELTEIYEECGATELIDSAELNGMGYSHYDDDPAFCCVDGLSYESEKSQGAKRLEAKVSEITGARVEETE